MSSISKVASPRPLSVECPSPTIDERTTNHNMSTESPGADSSRISGLAKRIEGAKGITKANQIVLMTQEELKKVLDERLQ